MLGTLYVTLQDFPGSPKLGSLPTDVADPGSIPDWGRFHMPRSLEACESQVLLLSPGATTRRHYNEKPQHCHQQQPAHTAETRRGQGRQVNR